jgi:hypothetical protein
MVAAMLDEGRQLKIEHETLRRLFAGQFAVQRKSRPFGFNYRPFPSGHELFL